MVVGQEYESGMITYILKIGDVGYDPNKIKGFCTSLEDLSENPVYFSNTLDAFYGTLDTIYDGDFNSHLIISGNGTIESAPELCANYNAGGFTNWVMPTRDQLGLISALRTELDLKPYNYLTSTEYSATAFYVRDMNDYSEQVTGKEYPGYLRAVREFEVDIPNNFVRLVMLDKDNVNYISISYWETFFNTKFSNYKMVKSDTNIEITLYKTSELTLSVDLFKNNSTLFEFETDLVTIIPTNCFYNCQNLFSLKVSNAEILGDYSFYRTYSLSSLTFNKVKRILTGVFKESKITSILIPNCIYVGDEAFQGCSLLISISLDSCIDILDYSFQNCTALTSVSTPMITSIGSYTFKGCSVLTTINSKTCLSVGDYTFQDCVLLSNVNLPLVMVIGNSMFRNCQGLLTISLPRVIVIGNACFQDCYNLTTVYLPTLKTTGTYCFDNCFSLTDVYIPLIEYISQFMFSGCSSLLTLTADNCQYIDENGLYNCASLTDLSFPKLTSIKDLGVNSCGGLININIPLCVELISYSGPTFVGCYYVETLIISKYLQYNNYNDEDGSIQQLRIDSGGVVVTFISDLTNKLDNIGGTYPNYADNAAAITGGLKVGEFYRTGDFFKVVH